MLLLIYYIIILATDFQLYTAYINPVVIITTYFLQQGSVNNSRTGTLTSATELPFSES